MLSNLAIELLIPGGDAADPLLSIVVPALNERIAIAEFVRWCKAGLASAGIRGEILIVDSSTDDTPGIALAHGARVLRTPQRGLGRAYIDAIPYIRGKYVLMGDADCTYDFRELSGFVRQFRAGYEFIMGSRFRGGIEPHSMPALHRYFGTPVTTAILNILYSTNFSDIHCGMRGITRDALVRLDLESQSWEYASEMVLKALLALGLLLTVPVSLGPLPLGPITLSLNWMMLGLTLSVVGLQCFYLGCIVQVMYGYSAARAELWLRLFSYDRAMLSSGLAGMAGCALGMPLIHEYLAGGLRLPAMPTPQMHLAVLGLLFLIAAFYTFSCTLVLHAAKRVGQARGLAYT